MQLYIPSDKRTLAQKFQEDGKKFIEANPLWREPIIPLLPLNNNYTVIGKKMYNIELLKKDLQIAINNNTWINKDKSWLSLTLKSIDGEDQSFLKETELGTGENNKYKYTVAMKECTYFKKILEEMPTDIYLVRILRLNAGARIKFHTDEVVFKNRKQIIRCHIPIITNPRVKFQLGYPLSSPAEGYEIWKAEVLHERHLDVGKLWYTNVNTLHGVVNNGITDRYHLVIDMKPPYHIV